jgi:hypothetical protein
MSVVSPSNVVKANAEQLLRGIRIIELKESIREIKTIVFFILKKST